MKLSKYFALKEFLASQTATRRDFNEQFAPEPFIVQNLNALCVNILDPLRESLGVPIRITSGYRCKRLNQAIGGAVSSQHPLGQAADIIADGLTNKEIFEQIRALKLPYDQLICEFPDANGEPAWIHVSFSPRNRRQALVAVKKQGKAHYEAY